VSSLVKGLLVGLSLSMAGCALDVEPVEIDGPEPHEEVGVVQADLTVAGALSGNCATSSVSGLSQQIIEQMNCDKPNALKAVPSRPNLVKSYSTVVMYMQPAAANALINALDANKSKTLHINSMLRTLPQQWLLWHWWQQGKCGIPLAATPGSSNHEGGLAFDTNDYSAWKSPLAAKGFKWLGSSDVYHFDYTGSGSANLKGKDVLAFQKLWNINHPEDTIAEDGDFGPQTDARLGKSPATGFPKGPSCSSTQPTDTDGDGIADTKDNCPKNKNADQLDTDGDGKGDACDTDDDGDGVADTEDNCPLDENADQLDTDGDGTGDVCDSTPGTTGTAGAGGEAGEAGAGGGVWGGGAAGGPEIGTGGSVDVGAGGSGQQTKTMSDSDGGCSVSQAPRRSPWGIGLLAVGLLALGRRRRA
jgi:MYXO-CTERM domain-containing protein